LIIRIILYVVVMYPILGNRLYEYHYMNNNSGIIRLSIRLISA